MRRAIWIAVICGGFTMGINAGLGIALALDGKGIPWLQIVSGLICVACAIYMVEMIAKAVDA